MRKLEGKPHPSHKMTEWRSAVIDCASNARFGSIRECVMCGSEQARVGGAGSRRTHEEFVVPCEYQEGL